MIIKKIFTSALVILIATSSAYAGNSALFLNIPNGAREISMGETGVSHATGGAASWWNPALIATDKTEISFQVFRWMVDGKGSFGGGRFTTGWGGLGFYYFNHNMEGFEARERPGPPSGEFEVRHLTFAAGSGFNLWKGISAGFMYKRAFEDIYGDRENGFHALDLGLLLGKNELIAEGWIAGASVSNIEISNDQDDPFPTTVRIGLSNNREIGDFSIISSFEWSSIIDGDRNMHVGVETGWQKLLFLRGGYMFGHDTRDVSFGLGIHYKYYRTDVSIQPWDEELGTVWRFGLGIVI
jgi:hypothetical protein